jgi:hypothetical protein
VPAFFHLVRAHGKGLQILVAWGAHPAAPKGNRLRLWALGRNAMTVRSAAKIDWKERQSQPDAALVWR